MRPYLKDGQLHLVLTKTERKKLNDALGICDLINRLDPISPKLKESARAILDNVSLVIENTGWNADDVQQQELPL